MKNKSYKVKNDNHVKKHKFFRGLRCYASSILFTKHTVKPDKDIHLRVKKILGKLSPAGKSVCLLNYHKAKHSSVIISNSCNLYTYTSAYSDGVHLYEFLGHEDIVNLITEEIEAWGDAIDEDNVVYIAGLDRGKMMTTIHNMLNKYKYRLLSNNCSRFAADVLLAGCNEQPGKFRHDRCWQMPANTLELAKEIARYQQTRVHWPHSKRNLTDR